MKIIFILILISYGCSSISPTIKRDVASDSNSSCIDLTRALISFSPNKSTRPASKSLANPLSNARIIEIDSLVKSQENQLARLKLSWNRSQRGEGTKKPEAIIKEIKSLLAKSKITRQQLAIEKLNLALSKHLSADDFEIIQKFSDGRVVNQKYFSGPASSPPFMEEVPAVHIRLKKPILLLRVHNSTEDGYKGSWFMPFHDKSIWEMSPQQLIDILALPSSNSSQTLSVIELKKGDEFILGGIGEQINAPGEAGADVFGISGLGGQLQYWRMPEKKIDGKIVKQEWLKEDQVREKTLIFNSKKLNEIRYNIRVATTLDDIENIEDDLFNFYLLQKADIERHTFDSSDADAIVEKMAKRLEIIKHYILLKKSELSKAN